MLGVQPHGAPRRWKAVSCGLTSVSYSEKKKRSLFSRYKNKLRPPKPLQMYTKVESWEYIESIDNDFIFHCVQDCSLNQLQSLDRQVPGRVPLNHFCCIFVIFLWHTWILPASDSSICRQNCYCCPRPECSSDKVA